MKEQVVPWWRPSTAVREGSSWCLSGAPRRPFRIFRRDTTGRVGSTGYLVVSTGREAAFRRDDEVVQTEVTEPLDGDLVDAARNGSTPAFELLVQRYRDRVHGLAYRISNDHTDAQNGTRVSEGLPVSRGYG